MKLIETKFWSRALIPTDPTASNSVLFLFACPEPESLWHCCSSLDKQKNQIDTIAHPQESFTSSTALMSSISGLMSSNCPLGKGDCEIFSSMNTDTPY